MKKMTLLVVASLLTTLTTATPAFAQFNYTPAENGMSYDQGTGDYEWGQTSPGYYGGAPQGTFGAPTTSPPTYVPTAPATQYQYDDGGTSQTAPEQYDATATEQYDTTATEQYQYDGETAASPAEAPVDVPEDDDRPLPDTGGGDTGGGATFVMVGLGFVLAFGAVLAVGGFAVYRILR